MKIYYIFIFKFQISEIIFEYLMYKQNLIIFIKTPNIGYLNISDDCLRVSFNDQT